ncbi:MAG: TIGR04053 family radical SAM/SPASM domain-containing protein [Thermogutta sp.]
MSEVSASPKHALRFADYDSRDIANSPLMLYYEVTQACDLVCKHCRASAQAQAHPEELSTELGKLLIEQAASFPKKPNLVFTGGDPLKRSDLFELLEYAVARGLNVALTPSATPLATSEALRRARDTGVSALGISLDAADAATHDAFRGWEGSFARTLEILESARSLGFYIQVNTTITRRNVDQIDAMADLLRNFGIHMWSVFFLVPVGRGIFEERISPEEYEQVFARLWFHAQHQPYALKSTEAPHYRRFVLEALRREENERDDRDVGYRLAKRLTIGIGDGKGIMFVSHIGEIYPAGFLPLVCGRFPRDSIVDIYQNHKVFRELRDPELLRGKCGTCAYRAICGGSRARAYAVTGDYLAAEPDCVFQCAPGSFLIPPG